MDAADPDVLIAVARCVRTAPDTAEMAIVVGDPWQGLGLGRRLRGCSRTPPPAEGVTRIAGTMLADNRPALRLMRGFGAGFDARRDVARRARSRHTSGRLTRFAQAPRARADAW